MPERYEEEIEHILEDSKDLPEARLQNIIIILLLSGK